MTADNPNRFPAEIIRLDDFLKFCGVVGTGGQAKILIQAGEVRVNGVVETRRRKQLTVGDRVELLGEQFDVER
jgi:ribosome-associated protein